ncbi:MAG: CoA-binding protein, partial [Chloroflexi bacterium CG07_land_8_20_14_0_80_51_10]
YGFSGKIFPVNPNAREILGVKTYPTIRDVPDKIDLAVLLTPRSITPVKLEGCLEKDIKAIVIVSQGFADADEEGKALQEQVLKMARAGGARMIGPNSFGVANAFEKLNTAFVPFEMEEIPV